MRLNSKRGSKGKVNCPVSISAFISRRGEDFSTTDAGQLPARGAVRGGPDAHCALRSSTIPARSEQKSTRFTNQSLKPRLTFYAFVSDCSTS